MLSPVLGQKLEELLGSGDAERKTVIDVPEADGYCLRKILQWLAARKEVEHSQGTENNNSEEVEIPNNQEQCVEQRNAGSCAGDSECFATFEKEYFTQFLDFCVLISAANRLQVRDFIDTATRFVMSWRQNKNLDDLRELLEQGTSLVRAGSDPAGSVEQMED
uniref:SKP1 component POZ domain-containing protein n=1 Tax=Anopheles epiroticus TaxID=199890 RepID=A0A182P516_9DIPT